VLISQTNITITIDMIEALIVCGQNSPQEND